MARVSPSEEPRAPDRSTFRLSFSAVGRSPAPVIRAVLLVQLTRSVAALARHRTHDHTTARSKPSDQFGGSGAGAREKASAGRAAALPRRTPSPEDRGDHARWRTLSPGQPLDGLSPPPPSVSARPVIGRRQAPVAVPPITHCLEHALAGPAALGRARVAALAIRVRVPLAVARLRVGAAAAAHPDVARLDRPGLLPGRVIEVRLDRRRRATQAAGDLRDRQTLDLAEVARQDHRTTALAHPVVGDLGHAGRHFFQVLLRPIRFYDLRRSSLSRRPCLGRSRRTPSKHDAFAAFASQAAQRGRCTRRRRSARLPQLLQFVEARPMIAARLLLHADAFR